VITDKDKRLYEESQLPKAPASPDQQLEGYAYSSALQSKPMHGLISSSTAHGNLQIDAINHSGTMESEGVIITIDEEAILDISAQTFKTLIILLTKITDQLPRKDSITVEAIQKGRIVKLPLSEYMEVCKLRDRKEARAQLNDSIKALYAISLEWDETSWERPEGKSRKVQVKKHHRMRITDHTITPAEGNPIKNGVAEIRFSFDMAEYLSNAYIMPYPTALLSINTHNHPYSIPLGWKLCTLHNMNYGGKQQNTTTVKTLLNAAKGIPRYESIAADGEIYRRIIGRLDRDLAALVEAGVLSSYWYFDEDGNRIEGAHLGSLNYAEFSALSIHYELKDYPDQTPRLEANTRRISAAISRNARKKAKGESN